MMPRPASKVEELKTAGNRCFKKKDWSGALRKYTAALHEARESGDAESHMHAHSPGLDESRGTGDPPPGMGSRLA